MIDENDFEVYNILIVTFIVLYESVSDVSSEIEAKISLFLNNVLLTNIKSHVCKVPSYTQ